MSSILVTGGAGFIGSHLVNHLLDLGHQVHVIDDFNDFYDARIKEQNLQEAASHSNFTLHRADICDVEGIAALFRQHRFQIVAHLAARAGVWLSLERPLLYQQVNIQGTLNLLEQARHHDVEKFIFASSSSVYGNNKKVPFSEDDPVDYPISPYAATKRAGELLCHTYHHLYKMPIFCLRFFTVYGPRNRPDLAIYKFSKNIYHGDPIDVFGDGSMQRDFTYIGDIIDGVLRAIDKCNGYRIYNLGESRPVKLGDLIAAIERTVGKQAKINRKSMQPGDVTRTYADVSRASSELGYNPTTEIGAGLEKFWKWYLQTHRD